VSRARYDGVGTIPVKSYALCGKSTISDFTVML